MTFLKENVCLLSREFDRSCQRANHLRRFQSTIQKCTIASHQFTTPERIRSSPDDALLLWLTIHYELHFGAGPS